MYSPNLPVPQAPALYTYYVFTSLLVIILALSLIWLPFLQLIVEVNTIISKTLDYANRVFGSSNALYLNQLSFFFKSQEALILIVIICLIYLIYLALSEFLLFADNYIYGLPRNQVDALKLKLKHYGPRRREKNDVIHIP